MRWKDETEEDYNKYINGLGTLIFLISIGIFLVVIIWSLFQ